MNWWKIRFSQENFQGLLNGVAKNATCPNFVKKTFANSHKTSKFGKVFSLESFPLYSTSKSEMESLIHNMAGTIVWSRDCLFHT